MIGDIIYHPEYGLLKVTKSRYKRLGNKTVWFGVDESGEEHELDDKIESPEKYLKEKAKEEEKTQKEAEKMAKEEEKSQKEVSAVKEVMNKLQMVKGEQGVPGETITGPQGEKGEKGDKGDQGEIGIPGMDGLDGIDGKNGKDGRDGKNGLNGKDGEDGLNGKDGSPDTPEVVREKLETLKGENRLDAKAIKNLPRAVQQFGGNGRNDVWVNTDKSKINSITVSVTAPSNPTLNDLWVDIS